jgi:hypothetical protein
MCRVYVARDLAFVGGTPDETEEFEILRLSPNEVEARIRSGALWDGMTIAAWAIARPEIDRVAPQPPSAARRKPSSRTTRASPIAGFEGQQSE